MTQTLDQIMERTQWFPPGAFVHVPGAFTAFPLEVSGA